MGDRVVIVESSAKARTLSRYLGKGYQVKACRGHVRDLPADEFGVDVADRFRPTYQVLPGSRRIVGQLRKVAAAADEVYLAADPDREGEAIAWHLQHVLQLPDEKTRRVTFNEITRSAVREAFRRPRDIDMRLVDAQQARRILDRIVGYELSPLVSRAVIRGLSAGRVQSVALRLVVERERERRVFEPVEYWELAALLAREGDEATFTATLAKLDGEKATVSSEEQALALVEELKAASFAVSSVKESTSSSRAAAPFITSTMQQAAYNVLRLSTAQTMRIAQQLYEGVDIGTETAGLITYMRTDSTRVSDQALSACRALISASYGEPYLPKKPNVYRSPKGAQAAHEAIRPSDVARRPQDVRPFLNDRQYKLYDLIWRRFVASQMTPARYKVRTAEILAGRAVFLAKGRKMLFPGYTRVMRPDAAEQDQALPDLREGEPLRLESLEPSQHFTQPPPRFTEASLVRELERQGIGRPSTYAPTISTLLKRNYVRRAQRALRPTDLGAAVTDLLVQHFPREMDVSFTSRMEEELDQVEEGRREWLAVLEEFYSAFGRDLQKARQDMTRPVDETTDQECDKCGKPMVVRFSRQGDRFLGCSGFPACKNTVNVPSDDEPEATETEFTCEKCGAPMVRRTGRRGREFLGCSAFPKCRSIMGLDKDGRPVKLESRTPVGRPCPECGRPMYVVDGADEMKCGHCGASAPLLSVADALAATELPDGALGVCPKCGGDMVLKRSRRGFFLGCSRYPECRGTAPFQKDSLPPAQPTAERCDKCSRPLVVRWGQYGRFLACSGFPRCRNMWKLPGRPKPCPAEACEGTLMRKIGSEGVAYLGCTRYPACTHTQPDPAAGEQK
jgi:DNA topoisomerase-1